MTLSEPEGFLAVPATGKGAGVLVLHAWWGLNETIKAFCTRLAESGFVSFAPDLYHGKVTDTIVDAETLSSKLFGNIDQARADLAEAVKFLNERAGLPEGGRTVIGFSLVPISPWISRSPIRSISILSSYFTGQEVAILVTQAQPTWVTLPRMMSLSRNPT